MAYENNDVVQSLTREVPLYHTRAMRRLFMEKASLMCNIKSKDARYIYRELSGDNSAPETFEQREIDKRVELAFDMQDPDILTDLREHNTGQPKKYSVFFEKVKQ